MNLGVEEQAQRRKKDKKRSRKKKNTPSKQQQQPIKPNHKKLFQTKIIKIQQRKIGLIIGQNGKNIKELYQQTHCDIILPKQRKKKDNDYEYEQHDDRDYYYVYDAYDDTEESNININKKGDDKNDEEDDEEDIDDPKRLVDIKLRGTPEEIRDAEVEINFMIKHGRLMLPNERSGDSKKKKYDKDEIKNNENEYDEIAEDIRIPSKICGMLIGGGGQRVKELMDQTGAEIWVDWDKDSHIEAGVSTVHLKGTRYSVDNAKEEIRRIQNLFEKGSNNFKFEIPAYCSKDLFGENGANLKQLQMDYNVTINVKNYRNERGSIRIGDEEQRIQRTVMIMLIGEYEDQIACKKGIDKLVGTFLKCQQCNNLKPEDDGHDDNYSGSWYCQDCWDEFNGVVRKDDDDNNNNNNNNNNYNKYNNNNNNNYNTNKYNNNKYNNNKYNNNNYNNNDDNDASLAHGMRRVNINNNQGQYQGQYQGQRRGAYDDGNYGGYDNNYYNHPQKPIRKNKW